MRAMVTQAAPAKSAVPAAASTHSAHQARAQRQAPRPTAGHDLGRLQVRSALERAGGDGRVLPTPLRTSLESQFGASLGHVRLHDTTDAHRTARRHRANAFTMGSDIYFGKGRYRPHQSDGRALVAHEVAHVLQHAGAGSSAGSLDAMEQEASTLGARSVSAAVLPAVRLRLPSRTRRLLRNAATLKQAIEDELDDVFVGIDNLWPMIRNEAQASLDIVRRDKALERYIRSEVDPMELLKTYLLLTFKTESRFPPHFRDFVEATDMAGTHEARIYSILRGVTQTEREQMAEMPGLVEVIEDEMSGDELQEAWALLYGQVGHAGEDVTPALGTTKLEVSERYRLAVNARGSFETVEYNLAEAATAGGDEVRRRSLLDDTSLWASLADEFNREELWYLRMIARYGGKDHFPKLTGPNAPAKSFLIPIWEAVKDAGTDEDKLFETLDAAKASTGVQTTGTVPGGLRATAPLELRAEPTFIPMLEDELTDSELAQALTKLGASPRATPALEESLEDAIDDQDMEAIRDLLADPGLSAAARERLANDPVILEEMGEELSGVQLCETSLLLKYGGASFPPNVEALIDKFEQDPIDVAGAIADLTALAGTPGALDALRNEPGIFFMLTNSGLARADVHTLLAALRADQPEYQEAGSVGAYHHAGSPGQSVLPVHFTSTEVRIAVRCSIDLSRMRDRDNWDPSVIEDWLRDIDEIWNGRFELENDGDTFKLVFAPYMAVGLANPNITIFVMDWTHRANVSRVLDPARGIEVRGEMHLYLDDLGDHTVAHEFGHVFGNPDEYKLTPSEYTRMTGAAPAGGTPEGGQTVTGLMGSHHESTEVSRRHAEPALFVINAVRDQSVFPNEFTLVRK